MWKVSGQKCRPGIWLSATGGGQGGAPQKRLLPPLNFRKNIRKNNRNNSLLFWKTILHCLLPPLELFSSRKPGISEFWPKFTLLEEQIQIRFSIFNSIQWRIDVYFVYMYEDQVRYSVLENVLHTSLTLSGLFLCVSFQIYCFVLKWLPW